MTTRGVFKLSSYRSQELQGDGVPMDDVWYLDKLKQKGYVIGGSNQPGASTSNYQSLSYDTDTRGNIANLPVGKSGLFGTASPSAGYTYGGYTLPYGPTFYSSSNKLVFSTETHTELPGTRFIDAGNGYARGGSCGSQTHGFICGGNGPSEPGGYSRMDRMTYATETIERMPGANMPSPGQEYNSSASGDGNTAGYWVGGANGAGSHVRKFAYAWDSWYSLPNLPGANPLNRMQKAGQASSDTGTYLVGGSNPYNNTVQKITFATGNNANVANSTVPTPAGRMRLTGTGNPSSGYFCGGTETSIVEKMNFSTNSISRIPAMDLAQGVQDLGSMSATADNKVAPAPKKWIDNSVPGGDAIEFDGSDDYVYQTVTSPYAVRNWWDQAFTVEYWINADSFGSSQNTGSNVVGVTKHTSTGETWSFGPRNTGEVLWYWWNGSIQRFYSGTTLSANRWYHLAFVHDAGSMKIFVDGILVNSDTVSGTPAGSSDTFAIGRITQNPTYFNGRISNLRITHAAVYSNNFTVPTEPLTEIAGTVLLCCNQGSATASTITPDPFSKGGDPTGVFDEDLKFNLVPTATPTSQIFDNYSPSLSNDGYLMGGTSSPGPSGSSAAKVLFATDTITALPNTPMRAQFQGGMSSATYGYSVAGYDESVDGAARYRSQVYKIQYATDSYSGQGNYPAGKVQGLVGVSAGTTHGYVAGGANYSNSNDGGRSSIQKFTFATSSWGTIPDKLSQDLMPSSPVPVPIGGSSGGNREHGYWVAMNSSSNPNRWGQMTKITYSTDTTYSGLPRMFPNRVGNTGMESTSACSSKEAMYVLGNWLQPGPSPSKHSTMFEKWTFSTDTSALLPSSTPGLTSTGGTLSGMGNWEYGIHNGSGQCKKIVYATETTTQNPATSTSGLPTPRWDREGIAVSARDGDGGKISNPVVC